MHIVVIEESVIEYKWKIWILVGLGQEKSFMNSPNEIPQTCVFEDKFYVLFSFILDMRVTFHAFLFFIPQLLISM